MSAPFNVGRASSTAAPQLDCVSDGPIASTEVRISETKATAWSLVFLILTRSATPRQRDAARRLHNHDQIRMWFGDRAISHSIMDNDAGVSTAPNGRSFGKKTPFRLWSNIFPHF